MSQVFCVARHYKTCFSIIIPHSYRYLVRNACNAARLLVMPPEVGLYFVTNIEAIHESFSRGTGRNTSLSRIRTRVSLLIFMIIYKKK